MIARIAERAIWRPKLDDTFLTPNASALHGLLQIRLELRRLVGRERLGADLEALVVAVRRGPATLDLTAFACPTRAACCANRLERGRRGRLEGDLRAALEVDPEVEPADPEREHRDRDHGGRDPEPEPPATDEVDLQPGRDAAAGGADHSGVLEELRAGEQREERPGGEHGRQHRDRGTDQEHQGESAHRRRGDREQDERGDRGDHVGVDDRRKALRVAGLDRCLDAAPGSRLFLDALEDDDVRIGGHPQRQHEAGEAGERQGHVEDEDRGVEEGRVDPEPEHRDEAEETVEDEQEERDEEQADDRRLLRLVQRVLAEGRRDRGLVERDELDGQCAGLENEGQVLRLLDVADPGDLGTVRARDPARILLPVDRRPRLDLAVEHDREVLLDLLATADRVGEQLPALRLLPRDVGELLTALLRELHRHDRRLRLGVEVLPRSRELQVGAGHLRHVGRRVLEEVVRVRRRVRLGDAGADDLADPAGDDDGSGRHREQLVAVRDLAVELAERPLLGGDRARDELLASCRTASTARESPSRPAPAGLRAGRRRSSWRPGSGSRRSTAAPGSPRGRRARAGPSCR